MDARRFVWKNIVTRFGVPHTLISDNGLQFDSKVEEKKKTKQNKEGGVWDTVNKRKERKTKWKKKVWEMKFWQNCRKVKNGGNL